MPTKRTWSRIAAILTVFAGAPLYWTLNPPLLPIGRANGTYRNPCCEPITLLNGEMRFSGSNLAEYQVEHDKAGPYVITKRFVGVADNRVYAERSQGGLITRLTIENGCKYLDLISKPQDVRFSTC